MSRPGEGWWTATSRIRVVSAVLMLTVVIWQLAVDALAIPKYLLPSPIEVAKELKTKPAWFLINAYYTVSATVIGFLIAAVVGISVAIATVTSRVVEQGVYALLVAFNSIPKVAIAPLLILWVGSGAESKWAMAAIIAIFPIIIDTALGLRSIEPDTVDLARSMGWPRRGILMRIRIPNALPSMFAGLKVAVSFALIGTIVGEFVSASRGLGYIISTAQAEFNTTRIFSALVLLAVCGTALFYILDFLERIVLPWHVSQRSQHGAAP